MQAIYLEKEICSPPSIILGTTPLVKPFPLELCGKSENATLRSIENHKRELRSTMRVVFRLFITCNIIAFVNVHFCFHASNGGALSTPNPRALPFWPNLKPAVVQYVA